MAKKTSEPHVEYQRTRQSTLHAHPVVSKIKISTLRGKLKVQSEEDIQNQISILRGEWERFT
jgi:hypothetical protein